MVIIIHILTVLFAIASFIIIKKKRYKVMPLISLLIFISFIGFGIISIISLVVPYGGTLIYPLGSIILGLIFIWDIFLTAGITMLLAFLPVLWSVIR